MRSISYVGRSILPLLAVAAAIFWAGPFGLAVAEAEAQEIVITPEAPAPDIPVPDIEGSLWLAVQLSPDTEHSFWQDGLSGPELSWSSPHDVSLGKTLWPKPHVRNGKDGVSFVYPQGSVILQQIWLPDSGPESGPESDSPASVEINLTATVALCAEDCVSRTIEGSLVIGDASDAPAPETAALFAAARDAAVPTRTSGLMVRAGDGRFYFGINKTGYDNVIRDEHRDTVRAFVLPLSSGWLAESGALPLNTFDTGYFTEATLARGFESGDTSFDALLAFENSDGEFSFRSISKDNTFGMATTTRAMTAHGESLGLSRAIWFALIGGILLNIMPCVFPVLAMKALSFTSAAAQSSAALRRDGWAYTAGILVSFLIVAGLLQAIRAYGTSVGWGFQLQSPAFVYFFALMFFVIGLNLLGFFELGGRFQAMGQSLTEKKGVSGSFFTGALATVVATPCTVPFMAPAIGYALTQPATTGMAVFLSLGAGLALPYLLISHIPAIRRIFPKPGAWMATFKEFLAFPMFASAAWLIWVLNAQSGSTGMLVILAAIVVIGFGVWLSRKLAGGNEAIRKLAIAVTIIAVLSPLALPRALPHIGSHGIQSTFSPDVGIHAEVYSKERLDELRAQGRPVFLHFWAAWCIICIMHENLVFSTPEFQAYLAENDIVFMEIDNTLDGPVNTALMESFGRSGQPLDIFYPGDLGKPAYVLPKLFTTQTVTAAIDTQL